MITLRVIAPDGVVQSSKLDVARIEITQNVFDGTLTACRFGQPQQSTFETITSLPVLEIGRRPSDYTVRVVDDRIKGRASIHHNGRPIERHARFLARDGDVVRVDEWVLRIGRGSLPRTTLATEERFLAAIDEEPRNDDVREVYADWLEENGRIAGAELLRYQSRLQRTSPDDPELPMLTRRLQEAARDVGDDEWKWRVSRPALERSPVPEDEVPRFVLECPKTWDSLTRTDDPRKRHCATCAQVVSLATTLSEARGLAFKRQCVALDLTIRRTPKDLDFVPVARMGMVLSCRRW